jgi:uncharacterized RDD family membrane protein YckC
MAASGITVLKHNVPWGPFTRAQIDEGLARGDFTLTSLAHGPGLTEWRPLGEVLDYLARRELPPIPESRELPPIPGAAPSPAPISTPLVVPAATPMMRPLAVPAPPPSRAPEPAPAKPQAPPVLPKPELAPAAELETAPFFLRAIGFLVDCGVIFSPVLLLFVLGALSIEIPAWWGHTKHEIVAEEWDQLWHNAKRMAALLAIGCGWLYAAWYESSAAQATIGKRWMGLKVVDEQGERISFLRATGRYAAKYVSALPCFLGFIMAIFSSRGRALHDRLAGTRVVRD